MSRESSPGGQPSRPWPRSAEIDSLRARFPQWVIERDDRPSPPRWSAVARDLTTVVYSITTPDLAELVEVLTAAQELAR